MSETTQSLHRTCLYELHEQAGARFTDFAGFAMPVRYEGEREEHRAVRTQAGLFDLSHMGQVEVSGPDAAALLDAVLMSNMSIMPVGKAKYTVALDEQAGLVDDLIVYRLEDQEFLVVPNAANRVAVLSRLEAAATNRDVRVYDHTFDRVLIAIQGPWAASFLQQLTQIDLAELKYYSFRVAQVAGIADVLIARTGYTGEDGFELYAAAGDGPALWDALLESTLEDTAPTRCGLACRDTLRLEAGMPLYGQELSREHTPYEVGLGGMAAGALKKASTFTGREALSALADAAAPTTLIGVVTQGRRAPRTGYTVRDLQGSTVGEVTSGTLSPTLEHPVAIVRANTPAPEIGTELVVDVRGKDLPARVVSLPFYRRNA